MADTLHGRPVVGGRGRGPALVTTQPMNFTAAFTKPANLLPSRRDLILDRHHELLGERVRGRVVVYPATIGSTYTGMVLLELMFRGCAPAAIVARRADTLMAAGPILADAWFSRGIPVVEYGAEDLFARIRTGDPLDVDGDTGLIAVG